MRIEMEFKIEQEKLAQAKAEADRAEAIRKETMLIQKRQQEFSALESQLGDLLPKINEANQIATELKRDIKFNAKMHREISTRKYMSLPTRAVGSYSSSSPRRPSSASPSPEGSHGKYASLI